MTKDLFRVSLLAVALTVAGASHAWATCGDGVVDPGEQCDLGSGNGSPTSCCTTLCEFRASNNVCRPSAGACDIEEKCTGTSDTCPSDMFEPSNFVCRPSAGTCDVAETCSGTGPSCPQDGFKDAGTVCRAPAGSCDVSEFCDGNSPDCPQDMFVSAGTVCRSAVGDCDVAESCTGTDPNCPSDMVKPANTVCRPSTGTCDPAETCDGSSTACPPDSFATDGTPCNDGSACTENDMCFRGACVGTQNLDACIDDFLCYKSRPSTGSSPFTVITNVHLVDQFNDTHFDVVKPKHLCTPTDKNNTGIVDSATHLRSYLIRTSAGAPRDTPHTNVLVTNQLGPLHVDTTRADLLLVPTAKSLTGPPGPPNPSSNVDHYKCYRVRVTPGTARFPRSVPVGVADQFGTTQRIMRLKHPRHLCTPVDKNGEGIKNPTGHLMCYIGRSSPRVPKRVGVFLDNQFGQGKVDRSREQEFCIPSQKG